MYLLHRASACTRCAGKEANNYHLFINSPVIGQFHVSLRVDAHKEIQAIA
jgi:hypothetical protein